MQAGHEAKDRGTGNRNGSSCWACRKGTTASAVRGLSRAKEGSGGSACRGKKGASGAHSSSPAGDAATPESARYWAIASWLSMVGRLAVEVEEARWA